jgi:heterodisulfide reductase subunit A-like polyferredoxin/coenzyme F420-reducing hydrogenase delta subunit
MESRKRELVGGVVVIGGGVAGLEVARNLSYAGLGVNVIEREKEVGGVVRKLTQLYPEGMPNAHTLQPLIDEVRGLKNVKILTNAKIEEVKGDIGDYEIKITQNGKKKRIKAGAIIVATGLKDYEIGEVTAYGYGRYKNVLKPLEFEERIAAGEINPKDLKSVVIVNCAGSRDKKYLPYCSRVCCFIGLKEAKLIKDKNPDTEVYVTYIDMRSYGNLESLYNTLRDNYHVNFLEGRPSVIEEVNGALFVNTEDKVLGDTLRIPADYVILSHGYVGDEDTLGMLNIPLDTGDKGMFPTTYINSSLSVDSNPKGVFICGCAAYPKNVAETLSGARAASLSAINALRDLSQKRPSAEIDGDICSEHNCKLCLYACPYGAIVEEEGKLRVVSGLCMGCGVCTATCPTGASSLEGLTDSDLFSQVDEKVKKGDTVAFLCKWSAYPAYESLGKNGNKKVKVIEVPCTGRVNAGLILRVLKKDAKNVLISGCYPDGCHYNKGNLIMRRRLSLTRNVLEQFGIPQEKVRIEWIGKKEPQRVKTIFNEMRGRG